MSHSRRIAIMVIAMAVAGVSPAALQRSNLRLNRTPSMPTGLYRIVPGPASVAGICLPGTVLQRALAAGLVVPSGECPDGREPILKTVYRATPDSPISFTSAGFIVGHRLLANTAAKLRSKTGAALEHSPFGDYTTGLWAISDFNPDSFDSRYFGPVSESSVRFYAVPILLF